MLFFLFVACARPEFCLPGLEAIPEDCPIAVYEVCTDDRSIGTIRFDGTIRRPCRDIECTNERQVVLDRCRILGWEGDNPNNADSGDPPCTPERQCCRVCTDSQACGDSCISRDLTCNEGDGCACDAADVCR